MPSHRHKLNATSLGVFGLLCVCWLPVGCGRTLDIEVQLQAPSDPLVFGDIELRVRGLVGGRLETLGEGLRWDQGDVTDLDPIPPEVERVIVEGLRPDGSVQSSGASVELDLLRTPPDGPIRIFFSRVGVLSELDVTGPVRVGAFATPLQDGRLLFAGGRDDQGCMVETSEIWTAPETLSDGPSILGGRSGDVHVASTPGGQVLMLGGEVAPDCLNARPSDEIAIVDVAGGTSRVARIGEDALRPGAATAVVSDGLVVVGGGEGTPTPSAAVHGLNPETLETTQIGSLESPRADASAVLISDGRVLFVGGRSRSSTVANLANGSVFIPERGSSLAEQVRLNRSTLRPALLPTRAGGVLIAGGGGAESRLDMMVVRTERDAPLGDTSTVTALASPVARGRLAEVGDGSALLLDDDSIQWIRMLPSRVDRIEAPPVPFIGGSIADGRVLLRAEDGRFFSFNPGVAAVLGIQGTQGELSASAQDLGIVPLRPFAWSRNADGLTGERRALPGRVQPEEVAVISRRPTGDFEATFDVSIEALAKAALLFGLVDGRYDYVLLTGASFVDRSLTGQSRGKPECAAAMTPSLATPGFETVRIRRVGTRVTLDVGADGIDELICDTPRPEVGHVALGLVTGRATFNRVVFSRP